MAKDQPGQQAGDFAELKKENDLLRAELLEEKSFSRRLSMQNSELYEECRVLKENLAFSGSGEGFCAIAGSCPWFTSREEYERRQ